MAQFLPGDESKNFTSPYAGGNFSCISGSDPDTLAYDKYTYQNLGNLKQILGDSCGLDYCYSTEYFDDIPSKVKIDSLKSYLYDFQELPKAQLKPGTSYGIRYRSFSFNCPVFIQIFKKYLELKGVVFERKTLTHIAQAYGSNTKAVFNCTGLGSFSLNGVNDTNMYPTRGQVVVVRAPHVKENYMRWGSDYATYIIKRPDSHDQLILGGFMHKDDWNTDNYSDQSMDILERTSKLYPELLSENPHGSRFEDLEIMRTAAGLRPSRHGGVRVERQDIEGKILIHNYGAGGYGYQAGLGMAQRAVSLLRNGKL